MNFSDYIIYVDESGDHDLIKINPEFPAFALSFCIIRKDIYVQKIVPEIQQLKFDFFGHDSIILREHDIRKEKKDFVVLRTSSSLRQNFYKRLNDIMNNSEITIVASVILKSKFSEHFKEHNPYHWALFMCMEKAVLFLLSVGQRDKLVNIICESRGEKEDNALNLAFLSFVNHIEYEHYNKVKFSIKFSSKKINSVGLQLADLTARPIALHTLRPDQENRAYNIIKSKFPETGGVEIFP